MSNVPQAASLGELRAMLAPHGQDHVLRYWEQLAPSQRMRLAEQIREVDWPEAARLAQSHVLAKPAFALPSPPEPAPYYPAKPADDAQARRYQQARERGRELVRHGKVAAFTVAGGQGSRLGYEGPKGCYPATPIRQLPLFGVFAEQILAVGRKYGAKVPWYVMTSPINHHATADFLAKNRYFGLDPADVKLFPQGMMPAFDMKTGKALLEAKDALALSPNGHGGSLKALRDSGALADMARRGVVHLSYTQVDNPLVNVVDPLFIGLHDLDGAEMSSKMVLKAHALEKVGNFAIVDGKVCVIEYTNLPEALAKQTDASGRPRFNCGSIAIHVIRVDFVERLNAHGFGLPWNRAEKKVPCLNEAGEPISPTSPNAVKLETFVFDALPLCGRSIVLETLREDEFAPIKNASAPGVADSPATSKTLQINRAGRWLESRGALVPKTPAGDVDAVLEIKATTALEPGDLAASGLPKTIERGASVLL